MVPQPEPEPPYDVVVVDDVPELRTLVRVSLELSPRFRVVAEGGTGEDAVALAGRHQPDLVLLDVSMPVRDGLEVLPEVLAAAPETCVVMLSGFESGRLAPTAIALGAKAYLEKGVTPEELVEELLRVMA